MPILEKVTQEDLIIYEILRHPVLLGEFLENVDTWDYFGTEREWEFTYYQKEMIADFSHHVSLCCGRAVGKCLHKDSRILDINTGEVDTIKNWFLRQDLSGIASINKDLQQEKSTAKITFNGVKPCFSIITAKGFSTKVTEEHPFLTNKGFVPANELKIGDHIAVPNSLNYFGTNENFSESEIKIIAHFIAEGTYKVGSITTTENNTLQDIYTYASEIEHKVRKDKITYFITNGIPKVKGKYLQLLEDLNLRYCHSYDKFIPKEIFMETKEHISLFLRKLFDGDGWVTKEEVGYATTSERLAKDIKHLLLRFGIIASLGFKENKHKGCWWISIKNYDNLISFRNNIGFSIPKKIEGLNKAICRAKNAYNQADIIPIENYRDYKYPRKSWNGRIYPTKLKYYPTRKKALGITNIDVDLQKHLDADIFWVRIKEIKSIGLHETYSIETSPTHTLVADDIYSHNTVSIVHIFLWMLVNNIYPSDYICYTVPNKVHLDPVWNSLVRSLRSNSLLSNFIGKRTGINSSNFTVKLLNGAMLDCRIAGTSGTGASVVGMHTPAEFVDEAGFYPWGTWIELQPTLNTWEKGFRLFVSGVPTGVREKNVLYYADEVDDKYSRHRISAHQNPRYTEEKEKENLIQYGGKDSDDYIHHVEGRHGAPTFAVFDRNLMEIKQYPVHKIKLSGINSTLTELITKISRLPTISEKYDYTLFGADLGYTDPSAFHILYSRANKLYYHARIELVKVMYPHQKEIINFIDDKFGRFDILGVDYGGPGQPTVQDLMHSEKYIHKDFEKRLLPIDFASNIVLGIDPDGNEIKERMKPFSVSLLQEYSNSHRIVYSSTDPELIAELERTTYTKNQKGQILYKTLTPLGGQRGADHHTAALLAAIAAHYQVKDMLNLYNKPKKLAGFSWLD